ncbi:hypothetical protein [Pseudonocardia alaniniphila]|uniref:Ketohydroxyglutarate aldolase n=1 Tax=Pseudonocardia alaniniphila TaxID=75291 RepID=A0ABS9TLM7_9PSEU|nr:hypothetical protein [Pseudonocardia alaniniphila]MCH6169437.1 hypothetical protein [Pseudonocardia alaniniphila]
MTSSNTPGHVSVTVTVDDAHVGAIDQLADRLRAAGMDVEQVLRPVGVITGSAPADWEALADLDGVAAVEPQRTFRLPPDGPFQDEQDG